MKYRMMINLITSAGLILGSAHAMAGAGWAFNYSGPAAEQSLAKQKDKSGGPGWAFDYSGPAAEQSMTQKKSKSGGPGWAFDHPHEPVNKGAS